MGNSRDRRVVEQALAPAGLKARDLTVSADTPPFVTGPNGKDAQEGRVRPIVSSTSMPFAGAPWKIQNWVRDAAEQPNRVCWRKILLEIVSILGHNGFPFRPNTDILTHQNKMTGR
jgi:hypothetical protein